MGSRPPRPLQNFFQGSIAATSTSNPWVVYSFDVTPLLATPGDYTLRFATVDNLFFHNTAVDDVSLVLVSTTVPEPISLLLMGTGLAAVGAVHRRRRLG